MLKSVQFANNKRHFKNSPKAIFNGTIISTSTLPAILPLLLLAAVWFVIFLKKWNESVALAH